MFFCTFFMWYRIILSLPGLNICQDGPSAIQNYSSKMLPNRSCSFSTNPSVLGSGEWVINLTASYQLLELLSPKESELLWDSCFFNILLFPSLSQSEINLSISFLQLLKILMLKQNLNGVAFTIPYSDLFFFSSSFSCFYLSPQQLTCQYLQLFCPLTVYFNHQKTPSVKMQQFLFLSSLFAAEFCWKTYTTLFIALQIYFSSLKGPKFVQQSYLFCINTLSYSSPQLFQTSHIPCKPCAPLTSCYNEALGY